MKNYEIIEVTVGDVQMTVTRFGSGKKNLVMLAGMSMTGLAGLGEPVSEMYRDFADEYTVYVFDRLQILPGDASVRSMAQDTAEAMRTLAIEKADVMGASQGGMIAQYLAIDYPEMVEKLILTVTAPNANEVVSDDVRRWIEMVHKGDHTALMIDTAEMMYSDKYLAKNRKFFPILAPFTKPKSYDRFLINANAILNFDARKDLSDIKCPTLIIAGDDDKTVGNEAPYLLNQGILNSEIFVYNGLGHGAFEEAKDFYDRVFEFCNRV